MTAMGLPTYVYDDRGWPTHMWVLNIEGDHQWTQENGRPGWCEFLTFVVVAFDDPARVAGDAIPAPGMPGGRCVPFYPRRGGDEPVDMTTDWSDAQWSASGTVKWDGCINYEWHDDGDGCLLHACGPDGPGLGFQAFDDAYQACLDVVGYDRGPRARPDGYEQSIGVDTVAIVIRDGPVEWADGLRALAADTGMTVIALSHDTTLDVLTIDDMRAAGWIRREPVRDAADALGIAWRRFYTHVIDTHSCGDDTDDDVAVAEQIAALMRAVGSDPADGARWERPPDTGRG